MSDDGSVSGLFPRRTTVTIGRDDARVVAIDGVEDEAVFDALGSKTARRILAAVYEDPSPASEVAECVDTSLQNARYHLDNLESAGLVEQVDTWYSSRGKEMVVYGRTSGGLVLVAGTDSWQERVKRVLRRLFAPVVGLALATVAVRLWFQRQATSGGMPTAANPRTFSVESANAATTTVAERSGSAYLAATAGGPPPWLLFLAGGLVVLALVGGWLYYVESRR